MGKGGRSQQEQGPWTVRRKSLLSSRRSNWPETPPTTRSQEGLSNPEGTSSWKCAIGPSSMKGKGCFLTAHTGRETGSQAMRPHGEHLQGRQWCPLQGRGPHTALGQQREVLTPGQRHHICHCWQETFLVHRGTIKRSVKLFPASLATAAHCWATLGHSLLYFALLAHFLPLVPQDLCIRCPPRLAPTAHSGSSLTLQGSKRDSCSGPGSLSQTLTHPFLHTSLHCSF